MPRVVGRHGGRLPIARFLQFHQPGAGWPTLLHSASYVCHAASVSCSPWCHSRRPSMNWKPNGATPPVARP